MVVVCGRILSPFWSQDIFGRRQPRFQCTARWRSELDASIKLFLNETLLPPILVLLPVGNVNIEYCNDNFDVILVKPREHMSNVYVPAHKHILGGTQILR